MRKIFAKNQIFRTCYANYISWRTQKELTIGKKLWQDQTILSYEKTQQYIANLIDSGKPFFAGKIGANEQNLLCWGAKVEIPTFPFGYRHVKFSQTKNCAFNAGIVPRDKKSYREFYNLLALALTDIDVLGIWFNPGEYNIVNRFCNIQSIEKCLFFDLEPFLSQSPWSRSLENKRVYLVTPFLESCLEQYKRKEKIWNNEEMLPNFDLQGYKFPYLFSSESSRGWQEIFEDIKVSLDKASFDIAIIGCGGLSLPLAAYCKQIGRQAIHLGGATQLLFGIRASRYEAVPEYNHFMNSNWVRPKDSERPPEFNDIENGCYW